MPDDHQVRTRKKLIEVALPLDAINAAAAREKSIRHGHPSTLHLWWARRPLAAARAVIFAQMVDDPSEHAETLLSDPARRRKAERELRTRQTAWQERQAAYEAAQQANDASVPEPGPAPMLAECAADEERQRLFALIEELVKWENTTNEEVLQRARDEIWKSWRSTCADNADHPRAAELFDRNKLPAFHDPFAGGGALPLEAQRLGLEAYASDLNPVAVLINKAMIEIPPKFAGQPPVNPESRRQPAFLAREWKGAQGLAEDVRYYGQWMRDEAEKRIGHLYPKIEITPEMVAERPDLAKYLGQKLTVIAWLWARTVKSPNPAFAHVDVPLASTFMLSTKPGKEAYVEPVIEGDSYRFTVKVGKPADAEAARNGTKLGRGANFKCVMSGTPITPIYVKAEGSAGRMCVRLMATVAEGDRGRIYLSPTAEMESTATLAEPIWRPETPLPNDPRNFWTVQYGLTTYGDLFTPRQLVALTTFSDLVQEAREQAHNDALAAGRADDGVPLAEGGKGAAAYADAVAVYLAFAMDRLAMTGNSLVRWNSTGQKAQHCFGRQALPMTWDFAEPNFLADATGSVSAAVFYSFDPLNWLDPVVPGTSNQEDAATQSTSSNKVVSTDPPYYDNVGYSDLSDFFYVWLRRSLRKAMPAQLSTLTVPKSEELVANPYRHGGKEAAETFFLNGMTKSMSRLHDTAHCAFPTTIYYAFKQSEMDGSNGVAGTGWETFLSAVIDTGLGVSGTWPVRTEMQTRQIAMGTNALASSIVLVCRPRPANAPTATRRQFVNELRGELPRALTDMQRGNIAPVDLAQAAIGPGMAVFTKYSQVVDAEGKPLSVRQALALINQVLDEVQTAQEGDFDAETRWAIVWFEQQGFEPGEFGVAETLSKSKNTSVAGMEEAGIIDAERGKVRLFRPKELDATWDPATDKRLTIWEMTHHLIRALEGGGESAAADLVARIGVPAETARELAYRLYTICERKKRAADALAYNALVQSWPEIARLALEQRASAPAQAGLFDA